MLTIENPFLMILTARNENGKLTRPNLICTLNRFIKKYPISIGNNLKMTQSKESSDVKRIFFCFTPDVMCE